MTAIRENGAPLGIGVLATFAYDNLGRRTSLIRGNGMATHYAYDSASRLSQQVLDLQGPAATHDLTLDFTYNPAGQIASNTRSNDAYAWTGHGSGTTSTTSNGLNQLGNWVNALGYDSKGNIVSDGSYSYVYSSENLLTSLTNPAGAQQTSATYSYDPLMRLAVVDSSNSAIDASLGYDGQQIILEGLSSNRTRRYVFGPAGDEPLVAYLTTGTGTFRSWYIANERGSTVRITDDTGAPSTAYGRYDEYGAGQGVSRFQYTGQYWLADSNLHYYRARIYDPKLGRFLQPDPIGYGAGMNMYAYVGGDPINSTDPSGTCAEIVMAHGGDCAGSTARNFVANAIGQGVGISDPKALVRDIMSYLRYEIGLDQVRASHGYGNLITSEPFTLAGISTDQARWTDNDFVSHYVWGNGEAVDLENIGLSGLYLNHPSVKTLTSSYINTLEGLPYDSFWVNRAR